MTKQPISQVKPIDDSIGECGFLKEELEVMTEMAVRVMVHEEPADQIFAFDKKVGWAINLMCQNLPRAKIFLCYDL